MSKLRAATMFAKGHKQLEIRLTQMTLRLSIVDIHKDSCLTLSSLFISFSYRPVVVLGRKTWLKIPIARVIQIKRYCC